MFTRIAPRIYCIPATQAPVVAVFLRGPSAWSHVGRWDLTQARYEPGAWLHGRLFPRRSDLSPDGRFLAYFAHHPGATWSHGATYIAVSKLPWLTALHAAGTDGTWTRGYAFTEDGTGADRTAPRLPIPYRLQAMPVVQFATERRRGWTETLDSPPRDPADMWDQHRNARLHKRQPGGHRVLGVESLGWAGGEFKAGQAVDGLRVCYSLEADEDLQVLDDVQWADWDQRGQLLVATRGGQLQVRNLDAPQPETVFDADLSQLVPRPTRAPPWAQHW